MRRATFSLENVQRSSASGDDQSTSEVQVSGSKPPANTPPPSRRWRTSTSDVLSGCEADSEIAESSENTGGACTPREDEDGGACTPRDDRDGGACAEVIDAGEAGVSGPAESKAEERAVRISGEKERRKHVVVAIPEISQCVTMRVSTQTTFKNLLGQVFAEHALELAGKGSSSKKSKHFKGGQYSVETFGFMSANSDDWIDLGICVGDLDHSDTGPLQLIFIKRPEDKAPAATSLSSSKSSSDPTALVIRTSKGSRSMPSSPTRSRRSSVRAGGAERTHTSSGIGGSSGGGGASTGVSAHDLTAALSRSLGAAEQRRKATSTSPVCGRISRTASPDAPETELDVLSDESDTTPRAILQVAQSLPASPREVEQGKGGNRRDAPREALPHGAIRPAVLALVTPPSSPPGSPKARKRKKSRINKLSKKAPKLISRASQTLSFDPDILHRGGDSSNKSSGGSGAGSGGSGGGSGGGSRISSAAASTADEDAASEKRGKRVSSQESGSEDGTPGAEEMQKRIQELELLVSVLKAKIETQSVKDKQKIEAQASRESSGEMTRRGRVSFTSQLMPERKRTPSSTALLTMAEREKKKDTRRGEPHTLTINIDNVSTHDVLGGGGGSEATIYTGFVDDWMCAVKEIRLEVDMFGPSDGEENSAIENEIKLLEALPPHPNVVRYFFHKRRESCIQVFMKKYNGTLTTAIKKCVEKKQKMQEAGRSHPASFPPDQLARILIDVAKGVKFLHEQSIIHRDLKCDNIFVTFNSRGQVDSCAIGDLDTAKKLSKQSRARTTIGSPCFIAPEVLDSGNKESYTMKADIHSYGMVIFELLALKPPYSECKAAWEISSRIVQGQRPELPELGSQYNPFVELFRMCTEFDPHRRPTINQIISMLTALATTSAATF